MSNTTTGVIGSGSFGLAISKLLAFNTDVVLLCRKPEVRNQINNDHFYKNVKISERVHATTDYAEIANKCRTIFPAIPSQNLREVMRQMAPYLKPSHFIIHCIKGFDVPEESLRSHRVTRGVVHTMSEVISEETPVMRIGCLSGPNLAKEILDGQPTATLVASEFTEVIDEGRRLLNSSQFFVFGSHDILGAEIAGELKNIFALGSGYLAGKGLGKNIQAMLITRGLHEMIHFGKIMGATADSFLGTAGIGDLIATATSKDSRNYHFGYQFAQDGSLDSVHTDMDEVAEGVRTLRFIYEIAVGEKLQVPITSMLYKIFYENATFEGAMEYLMRYPYARDVDFLN